MKAYLTRRYLFSAAHRLHNPALSESENRETYGKCNQPYGHGHNYYLEVTVSGPIAQETGMICDLAMLDEAVRREVLDRFDHQNLNELREFSSTIPTTENLALEIQQTLRRIALPAHLESIRVEETANNSFECFSQPPKR